MILGVQANFGHFVLSLLGLLTTHCRRTSGKKYLPYNSYKANIGMIIFYSLGVLKQIVDI